MIKIPFILLPLLILLAVLQIICANQETTTGRTLQKLEQEAEKLELENKYLESEVASQGSLDLLSQKAKQLGYIRELSILNLKTQKEMALNF